MITPVTKIKNMSRFPAIRTKSSLLSCAIFCTRRSVCRLSLSIPDLSRSLLPHFCIHCITSSIHVLLGRPLVLFPSNFPPRTSKALKPLEPLYMSSICQFLFQNIFFWNVASLLPVCLTPVHLIPYILNWFSEYVYYSAVRMHQVFWSMSCFIHISILRTKQKLIYFHMQWDWWWWSVW